ncbi:MAG: RNA polymerase, sigma-24 subunit, ECF subfamily [uncultured bacterium]|nr:MAG: RNA polymerase, sigma-24 subunit, ECF subfamily [uncultured bacterium]KKT76902.1 MAG: RNA polymerase, sigma-24 subunit, ECF subfamily [Candidatus Peregrinibacteria bacterium GW2011_GWA2_44_7]
MTDDPQQLFLDAYDQYSDAIFRYLYFRTYDSELARELMQETFMKTWNLMSRDQSITHLKAFLYKVAHNTMLTHLRKKKTLSLDKLMEKGFSPSVDYEQEYQSNIAAEGLLSHVHQLPQKYQDIIKMRYMDQLSLKEMSTILALSENVLSVRLHRALKKLKLTFPL